VQDIARYGLDPLPTLHGVRQHIIHAPYGLYGLAQWNALTRSV
jgi:hypothetical protein